MKVLGLDPGSQRMGYGVLDQAGHRWRRLTGGTLRLNSRHPLAERLLTIHQEVTTLIRDHHPELVVVEECFVAASPRAALILGEVRGVLLLAVQQAGIPILELSPRSVKLAVVGTGAASKEQIQFMIPRLLDDCPGELSVDEADALAIALSGATHAESQRRLAASP